MSWALMRIWNMQGGHGGGQGEEGGKGEVRGFLHELWYERTSRQQVMRSAIVLTALHWVRAFDSADGRHAQARPLFEGRGGRQQGRGGEAATAGAAGRGSCRQSGPGSEAGARNINVDVESPEQAGEADRVPFT